MPLTITIQALRRAIPDCRVIAFVDLSARLVLRAEAEHPQPQEFYDALCLRGALLLGGQAAAASTEVFGTDQAPPEAVLLHGGGFELFVRAPRDPDEALCAVIGGEADIAAALAAMRATMAEIVEIVDAAPPATAAGGSQERGR
ncbi:hypothetical protein [Rhodovulum kholense]|uniref:Roadblock/LC7 domain-containing protein n=1 Tax=Rhodovulum kholense TaxID=453584 RepID=A0A8E2VLZ0_9RHOB|nr:hypothetical protein [Rhodovulum kholense]PTW51475.1 hypothetical protein C8N38_102268 [Rhodovulum kholense]